MPTSPSPSTGGADEKVGELRGELRAVGRQVEQIAERQDQVLDRLGAIDTKLATHLARHDEQARQAATQRQGRLAFVSLGSATIGALLTAGFKHLGLV